MKRPFLFLPAVIGGLAVGLLVSSLLPGSGESASDAPPAKPAGRTARGTGREESVLAGSLAAFRAMVQERAPLIPATSHDGLTRLYEISAQGTWSPVRAGLEAELVRSTVPADGITGNYFLMLNPEGCPGEVEMVGRFARYKPRYALAEVDRLWSGGRRESGEVDRLRSRVYREWLRTDPVAALRMALAFDSRYYRGLHLRTLLEQWSRIDPAAAAAALPSLPECGLEFLRTDYAAALLRGWRETDPAGAAAWAAALPDEAMRGVLTAEDSAGRAAALLASHQRDQPGLPDAVGQWLAADAPAALTRLGALQPDDPFWRNDAALAAGRWLESDPAHCASVADALKAVAAIPPGPRRDVFLRGLADRAGSVSGNIALAAGLVAEISEGPDRVQAMRSLTEAWMREDPVKLSEWLAAQPVSASRHAAVSCFAELLAPSDPEAAARWTDTIPDNFPQRGPAVRAARLAADSEAAEFTQPE